MKPVTIQRYPQMPNAGLKEKILGVNVSSHAISNNYNNSLCNNNAPAVSYNFLTAGNLTSSQDPVLMASLLHLLFVGFARSSVVWLLSRTCY